MYSCLTVLFAFLQSFLLGDVVEGAWVQSVKLSGTKYLQASSVASTQTKSRLLYSKIARLQQSDICS